MRFTAIGFAALPDIETARRNLGLQDLSEKDVGKVLFHLRKQGGHGEDLGWDQQMMAAVTLVQLDDREARVESLTLQDAPEKEMINTIFRALRNTSPLVTWGGSRDFMPLLQFRCLKHRYSAFDYWTRIEEERHPHMDLALELSGGDITLAMPELDAMAQRLHLPGMLGLRADQLWSHWLEGKHEQVRVYADRQALNTALLALEIMHLKGYASNDEVTLQRDALFELIAIPPLDKRFSAFLAQQTAAT